LEHILTTSGIGRQAEYVKVSRRAMMWLRYAPAVDSLPIILDGDIGLDLGLGRMA